MDQNTVKDANGELYNWSDFDWDNEMGGGGQWQDLSFEAEQQRITELQSSVDLSPSAKEDLDALQRKLGMIASTSEEGQLSTLKEIDKALDDLEHPEQAKKNLPLVDKIAEFLKEHADSISSVDKERWEKLATQVELHPDEEKIIAGEFQKFQSSVIKAGIYDPAVQKISEQTGVSMSKIQAAGEKQGIKDFSKLTTEQAVELLPEVGGEKIQKDIKAVKDAYANLQQAIESNTKAIDKINDSNRALDNDEIKLNSTPFKAMLEMSNGTDKNSVALRDAINKLNKDAGPVLAAMLGKSANEVSYTEGKTIDPILNQTQRIVGSVSGADIPDSTEENTVGTISIDGESFSLFSNLRTGEIGLNQNANILPKIELPPISLGNDYTKFGDDDNANTPDWVLSEGYPIDYGQDDFGDW